MKRLMLILGVCLFGALPIIAQAPLVLLGIDTAPAAVTGFTFGAANGNNSSSSSSLAMAGTLNVAAGDVVVCSISAFTQTLNAATPSVGAAFTKTAVQVDAGAANVNHYLAYTLSASASSTYNVTVTTTGGPNELAFACMNATRPAGTTTVTLDVSSSTNGTTTTPTINLASVTAGDLLIGSATPLNNTAGNSAGACCAIPTNGKQPSTMDATSTQPSEIEYSLNATGGTTTVAFSAFNGTGWCLWSAAFKAT